MPCRAPRSSANSRDKDTLVRAVSAKFWDDLAQEVDRHEGLAGMVRAHWDYGLRHPNRYPVIACRGPGRSSRPPPSRSR